jgi:hypothetical protein
MPPVTTFTSLTSTWSPSGSYWSLSVGILNAAGQNVGNAFSPKMIDGFSSTVIPAACQKVANAPGVGGPPNSDPLFSCLSREGFRQFVTYQPASRYWAFQGIETGIYVAVAAALLAVAFYGIRHRDA